MPCLNTNTLYVAMYAGQYLLFEVLPCDPSAGSASSAAWLSIY